MEAGDWEDWEDWGRLGGRRIGRRIGGWGLGGLGGGSTWEEDGAREVDGVKLGLGHEEGD